MPRAENTPTNPDDPAYWEALLAEEGMPANLKSEKLGKQVRLGDGLGNKDEFEEELEDSGAGHSRMCPINLGTALNAEIDQPNDRPVESGK